MAQASRRRLSRSYRVCTSLIRRASSTFYLASLPLDRDTRLSLRALYAFCRTVDDISDSTKLQPRQKQAALSAISQALSRQQMPRYARDIWPALYHTMQVHKLPLDEILTVIKGVETDIHFVQPQTLAELDRYSYQVAGVVGVLSARILGAFKQSSLEAARQLGIGMQYTNILRDIDADLRLGRIYIPVSVLREANCNLATFRQVAASPARDQALKRLADRAEIYYTHAWPAINDLHPSYQWSARAAWRLYHEILERTKQKQYTREDGRLRLSRRHKIQIAWQARH